MQTHALIWKININKMLHNKNINITFYRIKANKITANKNIEK